MNAKRGTLLALAMIGLMAGGAALPTALPASGRIELQGRHPNHLQDVWREGNYIYWMQTKVLYKTDLNGKVLLSKNVEGHHAGCEIRDGKLYVAVCPMQGLTGGKTLPGIKLQVNEYDPETLTLLDIHLIDINDRAGSFCFLPDGTCLVGCLRHPELRPDQVRFHHLDKDFKLIKSHILDNVTVKLGIEVIKRRGDFFYLFLYKGKGLCLKLDKNFKEVERFEDTPGNVGIFWDGNEVWVGESRRDKEKGKYGSALVRRPDLDAKFSMQTK